MGRLIAFVCIIVLVSMLALTQKEKPTSPVQVQQNEQVTQEEKMQPEPRLLVVPVKVVKVPEPVKAEPKPEPVQVPEKKKPKVEPPAQKTVPQPDTAGAGSGDTRGDQDPAVLASYGIPVTEYLQYMLRHGARIGIYNVKTANFSCSLDSDGSFGGPLHQAGMSPRARRISSDFPESRKILDQARKRFGQAHYEILLLVPRAMDDRFYQNISRVIRESGRSRENVSTVRVTYKGSTGSIKVVVETLEGNGGIMQVHRTFFM